MTQTVGKTRVGLYILVIWTLFNTSVLISQVASLRHQVNTACLKEIP